MFKKHTIFILLIFLLGNLSFAQTSTIIDYSTANNSQCNLFYPSAKVSGILHTTTCGQVQYATTDKAISLAANLNNGFQWGTEFAISNSFKKGYTYTITINAASIYQSGTTAPNLRADFNSVGGTTSTGTYCTGTEALTSVSASVLNTVSPLSTTFTDYYVSFNSISNNFSSLYITAFIGLTGSSSSTIEIRKITIKESAPLPSFTLSSNSTSITCGSTTPDTLTVTGNVPTGATVSYRWHLGANNGWLYNGSAADTAISTTTNRLILTPSCGSALSSISATATVNGTAYNTNTVSVSVTQPVLNINGNSSICSGSSLYNINNLPCNATVTWSASPTNIVSLQFNGNSVTVTKINDGSFRLIATISNVCSSNDTTIIRHLVAGPTPINIAGPYDPDCNCTIFGPCQNKQYYFIAGDPISPNPSEYYTWTLTALQGSDDLPTMYTGSQVYINFYELGGYNLRVSKTNNCGSTYTDMPVNIRECYFYNLLASPNPATSLLNVSIVNTDSHSLQSNVSSIKSQYPSSEINNTTKSLVSNSTGITNMYLYDFYTKQLIKKWNYKENKLSTYNLNVAGVKRGIYILKMERDNIASTTKVILQ